MNKEFNDNNYQDAPHNEGQHNNIAQHRTDGTNNPPELAQREKSGSGQSQNRTESERANKNEDEGVRGGNSSI